MRTFIIALLAVLSTISCDRDKDNIVYRRLPKLQYVDHRFEAIVDSVICLEKSNDSYHQSLRFYIRCTARNYYYQGDVMEIYAGDMYVFDTLTAGIMEQQGHIIIVENANNSLFNKLFTTSQTKMKIGFECVYDLIFDDSFFSWYFKYEDGKISWIDTDPLSIIIYDSLSQEYVHELSQEMPYFSADDKDGGGYIMDNFHYYDKDNPQDSFNYQFVVDADGSVIGARIMDKPDSEISTAERKFLEVIEKMPKWTPGKINDSVVPVLLSYSLPVKYLGFDDASPD